MASMRSASGRSAELSSGLPAQREAVQPGSFQGSCNRPYASCGSSAAVRHLLVQGRFWRCMQSSPAHPAQHYQMITTFNMQCATCWHRAASGPADHKNQLVKVPDQTPAGGQSDPVVISKLRWVNRAVSRQGSGSFLGSPACWWQCRCTVRGQPARLPRLCRNHRPNRECQLSWKRV